MSKESKGTTAKVTKPAPHMNQLDKEITTKKISSTCYKTSSAQSLRKR